MTFYSIYGYYIFSVDMKYQTISTLLVVEHKKFNGQAKICGRIDDSYFLAILFHRFVCVLVATVLQIVHSLL